MAELWYQKISADDSSLLQGDIIYDCPIIIPPASLKEGDQFDISVNLFDVVILTQSCDLEQGNVEIILVCPVFHFTEYCKNFPTHEQSSKGITSRFKRLKDGMEPANHLLNKAPEVGIEDYLITDFRSVYGIHIESLKRHIIGMGFRHRLISPYREHLAQSFARFMMRVGLPQNIPSLPEDESKYYSEAVRKRA